MARPRFVEVPSERMLHHFRTMGEKLKSGGGRYVEGVAPGGREVVVDMVPPHGRAMIRVYTSLAHGAATARGCGQDAIRLVVGVMMPEGFKPLEEGQKMLRTAPEKAEDRVGVFLERLRVQMRLGYGRALKVLACDACGAVMRVVVPKVKRPGAKSFYGCVRYPECKHTAPMPAKV